MSLFGENPSQGQMSVENPLGLNQAPDGVANPGQPDGNVATGTDNVGTGTGNIGEGLEPQQQAQEQNMQPQVDTQGQPQGEQQLDQGQQQNQPQREEVIDNIDTNDTYERKKAFIKQKFNGQEDFLQSVEQMQKKLGRDNENPTFENAEQAIDYYISLEKELGKTSDIDTTRQENQFLKQELQGLRDAMNQLMMQQQYGNQGQVVNNQQGPLRNPQNGQFMSPNNYNQQFMGQPINNQQQQGQQAQDTPDNDINFDDIDVNQFMQEFYEKGPNAESFKKVIKTVAEQIADQKVNTTLTKQQQEQQKIQQQQRMKQQLSRNFAEQTNGLEQKYGKEEVERHKQDMVNMLRQYPMYLNPQLFPNGFEIVFNEVRGMNNSYQRQQSNLQNQQQMNTAQKMAAKIGQSQPGQRFSSRQPSQDEIEKQMLFQTENKSGLW